ncbi:MAG: hypothetical protein M1834_006983 [Cirrosporium novae-zelandiae]|nr:MAG: hypothetical protein M1834_006983 [Cirrosporium novae-zelandiae]
MSSSSTVSKIFVIGGTGAQGMPIVESLTKDHKYHLRILTRDPASKRAQQLAALPQVELVEGTFTNEDTLRKGFSGCDGAFVNIDGFNVGEKTETYWGIRAYELALESGIKFYVWGNLDYAYKKSGYDPIFRAGHYDGKGRVGEWILFQNKDNKDRMGAAIFTTGPYIDMSIAFGTPMMPTIEDGVVTCGMDLEVAIAHVSYAELAAAFAKVTGHPARYIDTSLEEYWSTGRMGQAADHGAAYSADPKDPSFMTFRQNFTGFWNIFKYSSGNQGIVRRDYKLLDEVFPGRIKSAEEWFRREDELGRKEGKGSLWERVQKDNLKPLLKNSEDSRGVY